MKTILSSETMDIPDDVSTNVKAKKIEVEGPRGKFVRNIKNFNLDFQQIKDEETGKKKLKIDAWFGLVILPLLSILLLAMLRISSLVLPKVIATRCVSCMLIFSSMPPSTVVTSPLRSVNSLARRVRKVDMLDGVTVVRSEKVKDELVLDGNEIELLSRSAALINKKLHVKNKDIRKFLDGNYVSKKGIIAEEE